MFEKLFTMYAKLKYRIFEKHYQEQERKSKLAHFKMYLETATLEELQNLDARFNDYEARKTL